MQSGIPYAIVGPTGYRIVVGSSDAAKADPDFVGYIDPEVGVTVSRTWRNSGADLVEGHGGAPSGQDYAGRASIVIPVILDAQDPTAVNAVESKIRRALFTANADAQLRYTPDGQAERSWWVRRVNDPTFTGRRRKTGQIQLLSARAWALSPNESSVVIVPGAAAGELGFSSPITNPITSALGTTGQGTITPAGEVDWWPRFRVDGPITNPIIRNNTTGEEVRLTNGVNLAAGEWVDVYPELGRVLWGSTTDRGSYVNRALSTWWPLRAGIPNDVRLLASAYSAGAALTVYYRNAWEA